MKKIHLTLIMTAITLFYMLHGISHANTFIYTLEKNGIEQGRWGIEVTREGNEIRCKSIDNFSAGVGGLDLLRNLKGGKNVTISLSREPNMMIQMERGFTRWQISTEGSDVLVRRYQESKLVDELGINPILPVYDLTSLLLSFGYVHPESSFDFYIIEEEHEKRLHVSRRNNRSWDLKYRGSSLVRINLRQDGIPEELNFSHSNFYNLRGYKLSLLCERLSPLEASKVISPANILSTWASRHHIGQENLTNLQGRFQKISNEYKVDYTDCLSINKDITQDIKRKIIDNMRDQRAIGNNFRDEYIAIKYDAVRKSFYPTFNRNLIRPLNVPRDCKITKGTHEIDLKKMYSNEKAERFDFKLIDNDKIKIFLYPQSEGELLERNQIGSAVFNINWVKRYRLYQIGPNFLSIRFNTSRIKEDSKLIVEYETENCEKTQEELINELSDEFHERYGVQTNWLNSFGTSIDDNDELITSFRLIRSFDLNSSNVIGQVTPEGIRLKNDYTISCGDDGCTLNGTGSLSLSQNSILDLFNIPRSAQINMDNNNLICVYQDFACPRQ